MPASYLLLIALLAFLLSVYSLRYSVVSKFFKRLVVFFYSLWFVLFVTHVSSDYFTGEGINDAVVYHLRYGLGGAGYWEYVAPVSILIFAFFLFFAFIYKMLSGCASSFRVAPLLSFMSLLAAFLFNPGAWDLARLKSGEQNVAAAGDYPIFVADGWKMIAGLFGLVEVARADSDFYDSYQIAELIPSSSKGTKNLVFIYLESLERTYFNESLFPGLVDNLKEIEGNSVHFTNIVQLDGTGWTIGGMTASLCGIPLVAPSHHNSMSGMSTFLKGATCLGDVLSKQGYELNYMAGAKLSFAGKGKFFSGHGFNKVEGLEELGPKLLDASYISTWGLYDDTLLDLLFQRYLSLSQTGRKFALFSLTLDTHAPRGHAARSCEDKLYGDGKNQILNAVKCTDLLVSQFVEKIEASPYSENTVIVLMSDHLAMYNTAYDILESAERRNFFAIYDPSKKEAKKIDKLGSTLDVAPTLLPFIGFHGRLGLGRNLLDNVEAEIKVVHRNLRFWDDDIMSFWEFPALGGEVSVDWEEEKAVINGQVIRIPAMLEIRPDFSTTLRFLFDQTGGYPRFVGHINNLDPQSRFVLFDRCRTIHDIDSRAPTKGFCVLAGGKSLPNKIKVIDKIFDFSESEFRQLIGVDSKQL
ncbi:sulfatase-like hydrolase/transferase [uncultured Pseudoteredinibacter sp.]|uniref:sulfatase-like hydrolase/transferase n=1 Tax=uncultured Pseudoteredinibacter sp. TaxID=1641701 RepID=UPI00260C3CFA|nr:sulfatase-like hydrolase/transferase [uncultured Pseudoteredinibacter sp.]